MFVSVCECLCLLVRRGCWFHGFRVGVSRFRFGHAPGTALPLDALPLDALPMDALPMDALPGPPKISLFFSLSRRKIRSFLPSLGVFSWNFGGV